MQSFSTEFPLDQSKSVTEFLGATRAWILGSPHTTFNEADLTLLTESEEWETKKSNESIQVLHGSTPTVDSASVRYTRIDGDLEWATTVACCRDVSGPWVGIRVSCESIHPSAHLPDAKKPIIVRKLLESLGGGYDGELLVSESANFLTNSDIDYAARCINGQAGLRLPFVYVSAKFGPGYAVEPKRLARSLSGMAHVLVEPNRAFSVRLKQDVDSQNVYGGTVGIYWPDGGGRRAFFLRYGFESPVELERTIFDEIQNALANRRPLTRCTWSAVKEILSRKAYQALKDQGSTEVEKYVAAFDQELKAKESELASAEREIMRLEAEVRKYQAKNPMQSGLTLRTGNENDLYAGELQSIVFDALTDAASRVPDDSRRRHVLNAIALANPSTGDGEAIREQIKSLLRDYRSMSAKIRSTLEELGFEISDDGKHIKIVFQGDDRYTFTMPKSGSDYRGGLNLASDISRLLF